MQINSICWRTVQAEFRCFEKNDENIHIIQFVFEKHTDRFQNGS